MVINNWPTVKLWYARMSAEVSDDVTNSGPPQQSPDVKSSEQGLAHIDVMNKIRHELSQLITGDPLLCNLPAQITLGEVNSQIALEYGQAMTVNVRRGDDQLMSVVVTQNATVLDFKHAIKRHFLLNQSREGGTLYISWKYVWKRHWLYFDGQKLSENNKKLKEYNIRNKDEVTFVKRLKER